MLASFAVRGHPFTMDLHQNLLFIGVTGGTLTLSSLSLSLTLVLTMFSYYRV